jgi:flagella basal body P-ring formation protein FlgA
MSRALILAAALAAAALAPAAAPRAEQAATVESAVVALRPIRAREIIGPQDVSLRPGAQPGALDAIEDAIGMEARVSLYAGFPVRAGDVGPPALVERNALVGLSFNRGGLRIQTEGRALGRAGLGERVRVMNMDSRITVTGVVSGPNLVEVR